MKKFGQWFYTQFTNVANVTAVLAIVMSIVAINKTDPQLKELEKAVKIQSEFYAQQMDSDPIRRNEIILSSELSRLKHYLEKERYSSLNNISISAVLIRILTTKKFEELEIESQINILRGWVKTSTDKKTMDNIDIFWEQNVEKYETKLLLDALLLVTETAMWDSNLAYHVTTKIIPYIENATETLKGFYYPALYHRIYHSAKKQKNEKVIAEIRGWMFDVDTRRDIEHEINLVFKPKNPRLPNGLVEIENLNMVE